MGCLISFVIGGFVGITIMCILSNAKDEEYREELIKRLKDEIYEEIRSSSNCDDKG